MKCPRGHRHSFSRTSRRCIEDVLRDENNALRKKVKALEAEIAELKQKTNTQSTESTEGGQGE